MLTILLLSGQTFSLIDYDLTVSLRLQESEEEVSEVGVSWDKAFAVADTILYIPLLLIGIIRLLKRKAWACTHVWSDGNYYLLANRQSDHYLYWQKRS
jgi:hypothetical protein